MADRGNGVLAAIRLRLLLLLSSLHGSGVFASLVAKDFLEHAAKAFPKDELGHGPYRRTETSRLGFSPRENER